MSREIEPTNGATADVVADEDPEREAERLDAKVEAIRDDLGELVGELDRRRHRAAKPLAIAAVVVAVGVGGFILWRVIRSRQAVA
jgi:hypothetical protein